MRRTYSTLLILFVLFTGGNFAIGQDEPPRKIVNAIVPPLTAWQFKRRAQGYSVVVNGKKVQKTRTVGVIVPIHESRTRMIVPGFEWYGILRHSATQRELQLTDQQAEEMAKLLEDSKTLSAEIPRANRKNDAQVFERVDKLRERLNQLLSKEQRQRFGQVSYRRQLSPTKILAIAGKTPTKPADVNAADKVTNWGGSAADRDWYDDLTAPLTEQQRQTIANYLRNYLDYHRHLKGLVTAQLHYRGQEIAQAREQSIEEFGYDFSGTQAPKAFDNRSGYYQFYDSRLYWPRRSERYRALIGIINGRKRKFSDEQESKVNEIIKSHESALVEKDFHPVLSQSDVEIDSLFRETTGKLLNVLTEEQKRYLEQDIIKIGATRYGVYASLVRGELGRRAGVSKSQRKAIEAIAVKLRERMSQWEFDSEEQGYERALAQLTAEQQRAVRERMGKPVRWRTP